jgi:uncharacterized membrane protein (DUF2068 family)
MVATYGAVALAYGYGTDQGWFSKSTEYSRFVFTAAILTLVAVTMLVQNSLGLKRPVGLWDLLKAAGCWVGAMAWAVVAAKIVPDTRPGAMVFATSTVALILWGMFYLARLLGAGLRWLTASFLSAQTIPSSAPNRDSPATSRVGAPSERVEIPVNYGAISLRFIGIIIVLSAWWWFFGRGDAWTEFILALGMGFVTFQISKYLIGHGPGVVMNPDGLSIRRGLALVSHLPWSDITAVELKSVMAGSSLVVGVRDPEGLVARQKGYARWNMRQTQNMFGSPARIPTFVLKCDRHWLLQTVGEFRVKYGSK